jgi:hypothetical protein
MPKLFSIFVDCKYLGVLFTENGNSNRGINNREKRGRNVIRSQSFVLWDKSQGKITQKIIHKTMTPGVVIYGGEAWNLCRKNRNKLLATGMDYRRRSYRKTRLDRIR